MSGATLDNAAIKLTAARPQPTTIDLSPLHLAIGPVDQRLAAPVTIDFRTGINRSARFSARGTVSPAAGNADLAIDLAGLKLTDVLPLSAPLPRVRIKDGVLGAKGQLNIVSGRSGIQPDFRGDASIANLDVAEATGGGALLQWARLDVLGIRYDGMPNRLAIRQASFDGAVSHVTVERNSQLNVVAAIGGDAGVAAVQPVRAGPATRSAITVSAPISKTAAAAGALLPISIDRVIFKRGTIAFSDLSIEPNFSAAIQGFSGSITGLSTKAGSQAAFNLKGYVVDRFAPVTITGRANAFAYDANTDITARFSNIELPVFNPYSGRFAGYAIARGKLSTEFHYKILARKLDAQHHVVFDQLTWGEATDSKQKVSLPIRLATSLLKDRHGVIDLDLPVGGTLDDPSFRVWPLIWKVVGNVLTKIVTAPFALIGSMFEGGEKAQFVEFSPGSAVLVPEAATSLAALAKGLGARPEIKLDIPAGGGVREDAEALATHGLQMAVLAAGKSRGDYLALTDSERADRLRTLYKSKIGKTPEFLGDTVSKAGIFAGRDAKAAAAASQAKWLETQLRPKFLPSDAELAALGQARAQAVKELLLAERPGETPLDPTRIFISTATGAKARGDKVAMELAVK